MTTLELCKSSFYRKQINFLNSHNKKVKLSEFTNLLKLALTALNWILMEAETEEQIHLPFPALESNTYALQVL